jgi:hypothetical protein
MRRRVVQFGVLVIASGALFTASAFAAGGRRSAPLAATARTSDHSYECQHPVTTGVVISHVHGVSKHEACRVALALHRYEVDQQHVIVDCTGPNYTTPVLVLKRFEGWRTSLRHGFTLTKHQSSFAVGGTDFPAPC